MGHCKGMEIASWLSDHADKDTRYVIIDDEYVIFDSQLPHFILTNPYDGITEDVANRAITILTSKKTSLFSDLCHKLAEVCVYFAA